MKKLLLIVLSFLALGAAATAQVQNGEFTGTVIDPSGLPGRGDHFTIVNDLSEAPRDCRGQQAQVNVKICARAENGSRIFVCERFADGADASARLAGWNRWRVLSVLRRYTAESRMTTTHSCHFAGASYDSGKWWE